VSQPAEWSYVQARLQARFGDRLRETDWHMLEAARSFERLLERSQATSLHRFTDRLTAQMTTHAVERVLRQEWHRFVHEISLWTSPAWRAAVRWVAYLPDLPVLDHLRTSSAPDWAREDPIFASLLEGDAREPAAGAHKAALAPLLRSRPRAAAALSERWLAHWRSLWPRGSTSDGRWLNEVVDRVRQNAGHLARADARDASATYRRELARAFTRMFRRHAGTPVALFCYLGLVGLDLERLRGGLVRRRLFEISSAESAA
jgi:hypothetical protein